MNNGAQPEVRNGTTAAKSIKAYMNGHTVGNNSKHHSMFVNGYWKRLTTSFASHTTHASQ